MPLQIFIFSTIKAATDQRLLYLMLAVFSSLYPIMGVWQGVAIGHLKVLPWPAMPNLSTPCGRTTPETAVFYPFRQPTPEKAVFYRFGHPTTYAYVPHGNQSDATPWGAST
jgi:hypothetical protein